MANHTNWLSISAMSGTSGQTILSLSASKNLERKDKTAEIIAYNPVLNVSAKTYVRLDTYAPYINLSPTIIGVEDTGGTYELNITANCPWVISYPDLVTSYSTSAGTGNATISFTVPGTSADTTLVGNIVVTDESGQVSKIARIEQYGSGVHIGIQPVELYFDATGGTKVFVVTANCVYNVRTYDTDWATVEPNSGYTGQTTFTVTVNHQNTGSTVLEGQIDIAAPGSGGAVVLYQKARETRLVGTYNVSSTTNPTKIIGAPYQFSKAELADGTEIPLATGYTFPITGYQEVYLTLTGDTVGANSLYGCPTLESVFIPSGVTTIGDSAFRGCSSLTSVTIPDTVTGINRTAFMETPISNITLPDGLQTLGFQTFGLCYSLTSIDIPSSVTSIGQACFAPSALETIYFHSPTPPTLGSEALDSGHLKEIIVPCVYVDAYLSAWPQYAEYISCQDETTLYFITDTSNVRGEGETRTITLLNRNLNPNRIGLVLPSDFPSQGAYTVSGNVITLIYPPNPSTADTRSWRIGIVATTKDGVNLYGTYAITQNANVTYTIPYTADTSPVAGSGETRTITIDTTNLVASSITVGIELVTGVTYTYNNGVITLVFPENTGDARNIIIRISGVTLNGETATVAITYTQKSGKIDNLSPLTFEVLGTGNIGWKYKVIPGEVGYPATIQYKKNNGEWRTITSTPDTGNSSYSNVYVEPGDTIQFKGDNVDYCSGGSWSHFSAGADVQFTVKGNIMSLIRSDGYASLTVIQNPWAFKCLFAGCAGLVDASELALPATTLSVRCYEGMFNNCSNLVSPPKLPATTLAEACYYNMFGISGIRNLPVLSATTLATQCYGHMFNNCDNLINIDSFTLPATVLTPGCYSYMFEGCDNLTSARINLSKTLAEGCYGDMFRYCSSLTGAPTLSTNKLEYGCYQSMFEGCTSLRTAPVLPATTLADYCYANMFLACTNLNYVKCLATDITTAHYGTDGWLGQVSGTGTFVKAASASDWERGASGIPNGWSIQNA